MRPIFSAQHALDDCNTFSPPADAGCSASCRSARPALDEELFDELLEHIAATHETGMRREPVAMLAEATQSQR